MKRKGRVTDYKKAIERKREAMISSGMSKGLAHPDTVKLSQELDKLIIVSMGGKK